MTHASHAEATQYLRSLFPGDGPLPNWIDGGWSDGAGDTFESIDPTTAQKLMTLSIADESDVERTTHSATAASATWWAMDGQDRARVMRSFADAIRRRGPDLGLADTLDAGRPIRDTRTRDVERAARLLEYWAGVTDRVRGANIPVQPGYSNATNYEPYGVVGAITPWNYPLTNAVTKMAPAIGTGNAVVLKPAEQSPVSALLLASLSAEVGMPNGLVNVLNGPGATTGDLIVRHDGIQKIVFTGSTSVGRSIAGTAGAMLKSVSLELGGKSPVVVFADADVARAARAVAFSGFNNQGQTCTAGTRLYVQRPALEPFIEALRAEVGRLRVGDPLDPATHLGPLISAQQRTRVEGYLRAGTEQGAETIKLHPKRDEANTLAGFFLTPTVFTNLDPADAVAREEIFGPVLSLFVFDDDEEALAGANDSAYGLSASIWTDSLTRAHRFSQRIQAGIVWINAVNVLSPGSPYGGYKQSGVGLEMGLEAITQLMKVKSVWTAVEPWTSPWGE